MAATRTSDRAESANSRQHRPVFFDRSGRRRRVLKMVGLVGGVTLAAALVLLILAVSGGSPLSIPGLPGANRNAPTTAPTTPQDRSGGTLVNAPAGSNATGPTATPSPTRTKQGSSRRNVPTQTPPHPSKSH